jgi:streptomycin 6-kinase
VDVEIPARVLSYAERGPLWADWIAGLRGLTTGLLDEWGLSIDGASMHGECALVMPVLTAGEERAVLKVWWPHWEAEHEHLALRLWGGHGAVRLLRADPRRSAMLLERLDPSDLTTIDVLEACEVIGGLYSRLHRPATSEFRTLSGLCLDWARRLRALPLGCGLPPRYVDRTAALLDDFAADQSTDGRIIHTDLHYFNVLRGDREPWLAIDPKPLSGDPCYEIAPLLWNRWDEVTASNNVRWAIRQRFETTIDAAGLDEERAKAWVVARMIVNALWEIEDPDPVKGRDTDWITDCVTIAKAMDD